LKQTTIKDIAVKLGLSVSTVSRALSDHPDISQKTKELIKETAVALKYRPNVVARNLKSSKSNQIGVIVPEIRHDFFANAISGIEEVAYQNGYTVIVAQSNEDYKREKINLNSLYLNRVSGIIISVSQSTTKSEYFKNLLKSGVKMVFFDRTLDDLDTYRVVINDYESSLKAVNFLIEKGYKKIIHFAGPQTLSTCLNRRLGYEEAMKDSGLVSYLHIEEGGMHESDGYKTMHKLLSKGKTPEAIFAVNDPVAIGAFKRLREEGIKIPEEVAIVGFSNNPICELIDPPLTTIEQPAFEMGKAAAELLIDQIEERPLKSDDKIIKLDTKLIIRGSA
jgi:LacI family transcriptional regulator